MNYREKMKEYIECPQFGNINYGKWGTLNIEQRTLIKRLLDEMDRADEYIKNLYFKNENLQSKINKAIEVIDLITPELWNISNKMTYRLKDVKNILKED